jgi:hypothetical protein
MSFRNIEVRVWLAIMVPLFILTLFFVGDRNFSLASVPPLVGWIVYYVWRFNYRKKKNQPSDCEDG